MEDDRIDSHKYVLTSQFFRDPETFQVLRDVILPTLIAQASNNKKTLRLWCAGCTTGEDAYSLAMLLAGLLGDALHSWTIRIFATDSDETALNLAKQGIYQPDSLRNLSEDECTRWFDLAHQSYHINKVLRKMVIIGKHNIAHDIPFTHMDLILCRGVLFTCPLERQHELVNLFAFSLASRHGYLVMERPENTTLSFPRFQRITERVPIYQSIAETFRNTPVPNSPVPSIKQLLQHENLTSRGVVTTPPPISLQEVLFRLAPTGIVVIDDSYCIVTANRAAKRLCSLPEEAHRLNFLQSIPGLPSTPVRTAIDMTLCEGSTQAIPEVELILTGGGNGRVLSLHISLLPAEVTTPDYVVIYIQEVTEQVITLKSHRKMLDSFYTVQTNYIELMQKYTTQVQMNAKLQEAGAEIISLYEQLQVEFEACKKTQEVQELEMEELQVQLETVCAALSLNEIAS